MGRLILIGLGIADVRDISIRGMKEAKGCARVFLEDYTSFTSSPEEIEKILGKDVIPLDRIAVEDTKIILDATLQGDVALLVGGDPMAATTHYELRNLAKKRGIEVRVIHSSSVFTAVPSILGLQQYKFGRTISIPYPQGNFIPTSPYEKLVHNFENGLHSLMLLDIDRAGGRFMTAVEGINALFSMQKKAGGSLLNDDTLICVVARAGADDCTAIAATPKRIREIELGAQPHSIVVPSRLHFMEGEAMIELGAQKSSVDKLLD